MTKTVLELINEAFSAPDADADASGYGFDSEFNEPVNAVDSNHSMEPENIAAVYFTESDEEECDGDDRIDPKTGDELLFDYETSEMISPEASQDLTAYFNEDMVDISTMGKEMDGEIPPGGVMDEQDFTAPSNVPTSSMGNIDSEVQSITSSPKELSPNDMGIDKNMSVDQAMGLAESLLVLSSVD